MSTPYDLCLVTAPDKASADRLARGLLEKGLAACVTVLPGAESSYWWQGAIEKSAEFLLVIKTRAALRGDIAAFVKLNHPYSVPETIFAEIAAGSPEYLEWLGAVTAVTPDRNKNGPPENKK